MSDERILVRMPDGQVVRVKRGTPRAEIERKYKQASMRSRTAKDPVLGPVTAGAAGLADMMTFSSDDEIRAGLDTINPFNEGSFWRGGSFQNNLKGQQSRKRELERNNPKSYFGGQVVGSILPALLTGGGSVAASAPRAATTASRLASVAKPTALAAAQGGIYGFNSGEGGVKERLKRVPEAAAWGAGGDLVGRGLGKVASRALGGRTLTKAQRALAGKGVLMTPGMRGGTIARTVEDKVMGSIPVLSDAVGNAQQRSFASLRRAVADEVLAPIGKNVKGIPALADDAAAGADFADNLAKTVYQQYDDTLGSMALAPDPAVFQQLDELVNNAGMTMTRDQVEVLANNVAATKEKLGKGPLTGQALREWMGDLRGRASKLAGTESGDAMWQLNGLLEDALDAQNAGGASAAYRAARESVANLKRYQNAASRRGAGGEFTPTQLLQAAEKRGFGTTDANVANRTAPLLDTALNAAEVMRVNTANSGTVPRAVATGGLLGLPAAAATVDPIMGGLLAAKTLGYVPGLDEIIQNLAVNRPAWARGASNAIDNNSRALGLLGVGSALGLSQ